MKQLYFSRPNNLSQLHDEIMVAIPSLAPIRDQEGVGTPVMAIEGIGDEIMLSVPDDAQDASIESVVRGHRLT